MFDLEGKEYILCLIFTLLLCGGVVYYFRNRFQMLEKAQLEQAQALRQFMTAMGQQQARMQSHPMAMYGAVDMNNQNGYYLSLHNMFPNSSNIGI